jgi:hypothetical protein
MLRPIRNHVTHHHQQPQQLQYQRTITGFGSGTNDNNTNNSIISKNYYTRIVMWFCSILLVMLQFMVAHIVHQHPSNNDNYQHYTTTTTSTTNLLGMDDAHTTMTKQDKVLSSHGRRVAIIPEYGTNSKRKSTTTNASSTTTAAAAAAAAITETTTRSSNSLNTNNFLRSNPISLINHVKVSPMNDNIKTVPIKVDIDHKNIDPILYPILKAGKMYSICRGDRSGSVIADMIYAHAFAYSYNITYAGNCCVTRGLPKDDTRNLIHELHWDVIMPFHCPKGVNNKKYNVLRPNATTISPLILNPDVYRLQGEKSNFKPEWRNSIQKALYKYNNNNSHMRRKENNNIYDIAVHVRRGDVTPCTYKRRYLPNIHYIQLIDQYIPNETVLNGRQVHVTIYSESDTFEPFDIFRERGYTIKLDTENLAEVWKALSTADVAILSRSYFSIIPATINPNIVVATEFFEFDVNVMDGWHFADPQLVKHSDEMIRQMFLTQCNNTKQLVTSIK